MRVGLLVGEAIPDGEELLGRESILRNVACATTDKEIGHAGKRCTRNDDKLTSSLN